MASDGPSLELEKEKKEYSTDMDDEEKRLETPTTPTEDGEKFAPIKPTGPSTPSRVRSSSPASFAPIDSYTQEPEEENGADNADPFEVKWEKNDPLDPRNRLSKGRKWMITFIIAAASLCVWVLLYGKDMTES